MKTLFLFPLLVVLVAGCDRLSKDSSAKIQIQMPKAISKVSTLSGSGTQPVPNGLDDAGVSTPINCYLVGVNGPEAELRRNTCKRDDGSHEFKLGQWAGGITPGGSVTLDVPSGKNRNFYVIGFHATGNSCKDFKAGFPEHDELSNPYIIGKVENVTLNAGETKDLPVQIAFDSNAWFEDCKGPDFPDDQKGGGGSVATAIQFQKEYFPHRAFVENDCQAIDVSLVNSSGNSAFMNQPVSFKISGPSGNADLYNSRADCLAYNNSVSYFTIQANENFKQVFIKTPNDTAHSSLSYTPVDIFPISLNAKGLLNYPNKNGAQKTFLIENPLQLLSGVCYPINVKSVNFLGSLDYSSVTAEIESTGLSIFSDPTCNTARNKFLSFGSMIQDITFYAKLNSGIQKTTLTINDGTNSFLSATKTIYGGSGSANPKSLKITGFTQMTGFNNCQAYEVSAVNENGIPVPAPQNINFSLTLPSGLSGYSMPGCASGGPIATLLNGSLKAMMYIKAVDSSAAGMKTITVSDSASVNPLASGTFNLNVDVPVSWVIGGLTTTVDENTCYPLTITQADLSGSQIQNMSGNYSISISNPNITASFYNNSGCSGGATGLPASSPVYGGPSSTIGLKFSIISGGTQPVSVQISSPSAPTLNTANTSVTVIHNVCAGTPPNTECPGSVWTGGTIYLGSLSWGSSSVTSGAVDRYMTTPGGCGDIPAGQKVGSGYSAYPNGDFTPTCTGGTDVLQKYWNDGSTNWHDVAGIINYTTDYGIGYSNTNRDDKYGSENALSIVAITAGANGGYHAAARYCDGLVYGGYNDWYLPNRYELNLMNTYKLSIPGLNTGTDYWSSTEFSDSLAWFQRFNDGTQNGGGKSNINSVRCVRKF